MLNLLKASRATNLSGPGPPYPGTKSLQTHLAPLPEDGMALAKLVGLSATFALIILSFERF